jgi:hypothetical protein
MTDYLKLAKEARRRPSANAASSYEIHEFNEFNPPGPTGSREDAAATEPKIEVSPEMLAEFQPAIDEFTKAGFKTKRISDGCKQPRGITMGEWKCREAQRQAAEYLGTLSKLPKNIKPRSKGETAVYYVDGQPFEWNHSAKGFTSEFWEQISEESAKSAKIEVLSWPLGNVIYSSGNDSASQERKPTREADPLDEVPEQEHDSD